MSFYAELVKTASEVQPRKELEGIMQRIYDESPWKWPYGLSINAHDEAFLIRTASDNTPVGFVGWQERRDGMEKVGFYTVGILPDYRGNGLAREAVSKLLTKKAASVDKVQALIVRGNEESEHLAGSLGVAYSLMEKRAGGAAKAVVPLLSSLAGAVGNATLWDQVAHPDATWQDSLLMRDFDKQRKLMTLVNGAIGALGGAGIGGGAHMASTGKLKKVIGGTTLAAGGLGSILMTPAKDSLMKTLPVLERLPTLINSLQENANTPPTKDFSTSQKLGLAALAAIPIAGGAYGIHRLAQAVKENTEKSQKARVRVTLPTKDPGDQETTIEAPVTDFGFSAKVYNRLGRDTRRRLRSELEERTARRKVSVGNQDAAELNDSQVIKLSTQKPPNAAMPPVTRTPWAAAYSQSQTPPPPVDESLIKKLEDTNTRIDDMAKKMQEQQAKPAPAPAAPKAPTSGQTYFPSTAAISSKVNSALKLIGAGQTKKAATTPPAKPQKQFANEPPSISQFQQAYDLGGGKFRGKAGIQTPFVPYSVPYGQTAYQIGTAARRALSPTLPSASAQFIDNQPTPQPSLQQGLMSLLPMLASKFTGAPAYQGSY